ELVGKADLEAHLLAEGDAEIGGDALGDGSGSDAPRLGVADERPGAAAEFEADLWKLRRFPGAGLAADDDNLVFGDEGLDLVLALRDGKVGRIGDGGEDPGRAEGARLGARNASAAAG